MLFLKQQLCKSSLENIPLQSLAMGSGLLKALARQERSPWHSQAFLGFPLTYEQGKWD